jgi:hypothetical protein
LEGTDEGSDVMIESDMYDAIDDHEDTEDAHLLTTGDQTTDDGKSTNQQSDISHNSSHNDEENDSNDTFETGSASDNSSDDENDADHGTDSDDELDNDSDDEWIRIRSSTNKDRSQLESDVDVIGRRAKYVGHCNKHVRFFLLYSMLWNTLDI